MSNILKNYAATLAALSDAGYYCASQSIDFDMHLNQRRVYEQWVGPGGVLLLHRRDDIKGNLLHFEVFAPLSTDNKMETLLAAIHGAKTQPQEIVTQDDRQQGNTPADARSLRAAIKEVLLGTPIGEHNRDDDGIYESLSNTVMGQHAVGHQRLQKWGVTLQDALDGKRPGPA